MATDPREMLQAIYAVSDQMAQSGLDGFLRFWMIDSVPPDRFISKVKPFQLERMRAVQGPVEQIAGLCQYKGPRAIWNVCARGYDKTGSIARTVIWLVAYSKNPVEIVVAAGDQDQAGILYDAAKRECDLNPWIAPRLRFKNKRIEGTVSGSVVKVLTADAPSSYGLRPDLIVCDELTTWESRELWDALFTARNKRPKSALFIISNAGTLRSWQHDLYLHTLSDPTWNTWSTDPKLNPTWMDEESIERDIKLLPAPVAKRLYRNLWVDPSEDSGYLTRYEIEACLRLGYVGHKEPDPLCRYAAAIDYGPKKDRTVMVLMHQDGNGICWIDECIVKQGAPDSPVRIADIESWLDARLDRFPHLGIIVDPYQLEGTVQRFMARTPSITRYLGRGSTGNFHMAELMRTSIIEQKLLWAPGEGAHPQIANDDIVSELSELIIKQLPSGKYRFDHENGGHNDRAVSIGMALIALHEDMVPRPHLVPEPLDIAPKVSPSGSAFLGRVESPRIFGLDLRRDSRR